MHTCGHHSIDIKVLWLQVLSWMNMKMEPTGPLNKSVSIKAIKVANAKVVNLTPCNNITRPYLMLTPA